MVNKEVLRKRLNKLEEYLAILRQLQRYTIDEFINDPERYGSSERFLQLAIEGITDIGNHVIADDKLGTVNWYSDIPNILEEKGYIDAFKKEQWIRMIGFRNALVHEYVDIDRKIVFDVLQNHLDEIEEISRIFAHFL
jgi:uncharacterized protein YutE (UPF0331/DUF86 family)